MHLKINNNHIWVSSIVQSHVLFSKTEAFFCCLYGYHSHLKELILKNAEEALYLGTPSFDRTNIGMTEVEITKIKRIYDWVISEPDEDFSQDKLDFISFVDEHDKRRGTNFLNTFPELTEFYNTIKNGN